MKSMIAGNWKMNKTPTEAKQLAKELVQQTAGSKHEVVIAPPAVALAAVAELIGSSHIALAAQNASEHLEGAYTGEISVGMLRDLGVQYVILGHSERRQYYDESDMQINAKVQTVLLQGLCPILCFGETLAQREEGSEQEVCSAQLHTCLCNVGAAELARVVLAYEPVWAIGTGMTASAEEAEQMHQFCRQELANWYSTDIAASIRILYGGSVKPSNAAALLAQRNINGALVGGASLEAATFAALTKF